jgi:tRNA pseudouridine55 synthase
MPFDFQQGEVLLLDKPQWWTSFDVVNKIRYALKAKLGLNRTKTFKVGHAGTLDPMATGLLILCTGKATKQLTQFEGLPKTYTGTFFIGATSPSFDTETEADTFFPTNHITTDLLHQTALQFVGEQQQMPPMFSAIKIDGKRAYKSARRGEMEHPKLKPRTITIQSFQITRIELPQVDFEITCSKGTYIRAIANDFGKALQSGAYLIQLRRTAIDTHLVANAYTIEQFLQIIEESTTSTPPLAE